MLRFRRRILVCLSLSSALEPFGASLQLRFARKEGHFDLKKIDYELKSLEVRQIFQLEAFSRPKGRPIM